MRLLRSSSADIATFYQPRVLVTVVNSSFNRLPLLRQCLASVARQSHRNWECLVCDDGSTDGTHEFVRELSAHDQRFRLVLGPRFGLPAGPRNRGIAEARGEWIAFIDDDDIWHPEKLALQVRETCKGDVDAVATEFEMFLDGEPPQWDTDSPRTPPKTLTLGGILQFQRPFPGNSTNLIRRDRLVSAGGFAEHTAYRALEDYDLWSRLQALHGFKWVVVGGTPLAGIRQDGTDSISSWRQLSSTDYVRQRWAIIEIFSRILAAEREALDTSLPDLLSTLVSMADECAHRSRLLGWRRPSIFAYRLAARICRAIGDPAGGAIRHVRALRFGMLGRAKEHAEMPDSITELRRRIARFCNAILTGDTLSENPLPISSDGAWSSLRPHHSSIDPHP